MNNNNSQWEDFLPDFRFWDRLLRTIFKRIGGDPYTPLYRFVKNEELEDVMPYVGMPVYPGSWANGKSFIQWVQRARQGMESVPYEMILNSDPAYIYMRESSSMALNTLVIAHAGCGHSHFYKHNYMFANSGAETIMQRLAKWAARFEELEQDPQFGIERLEYTLDAAMVLAEYCVEFNAENKVSDKELRRRLQEQLGQLEVQRDELKTGFDAEWLDKRIAVLKKRLAKDPINRIRDIGSFILDPKHNPGLSQEERDIIEIAFEVARYFHGQRETKFMNEGFASWCHEKLPKDAQATLPADWNMELLWFWTMFDRSPLEKYTNPYGITLFLIKREEEKYCPVIGEEEAYFPDYEVYAENGEAGTNSGKPDNKSAGRRGKKAKPLPFELPVDQSRIARDRHGNVMVFTGKWHKGKVEKRDYSRVFDVVANYRDTSFFREFLTNDAIEELNDLSLHWIDEQFRMVNDLLRKSGWDRGTLVDPVPATLAGKMQAVRQWMGLAQTSQAARGEAGVPIFPAPPMNLRWMAELLQMISAYHSDKTAFRQHLLMRLSLIHATPDLAITDGGRDSAGDGTLVIEHQFDDATGFLRESWTRESLKLLPRLWKRGGVKVVTKEGETDDDGEITKIYDYFYAVDRNGKLTEGKL